MPISLARTAATVQSYTLNRLEELFGGLVPATLWAAAGQRDRIYTPALTFWCLVWQALRAGASGRAVVRQLQAVRTLQGAAPISPADGAYFRACARLPLHAWAQAVQATAQAADRAAPPPAQLRGRPLQMLDGCVVTLADTPANRQQYPVVQRRPSSFPLLRMLVQFSAASGTVSEIVTGSLYQSEHALLKKLPLVPGTIVVGDRLFGSFPVVAWLRQQKVDFVGRSCRRLPPPRRGGGDWTVVWKKGATPSPWLTPQEWQALPQSQTMRVVRSQVHRRGFRSQTLTVVTTLLDPVLYPKAQILAAYLRRWRLEMCLDDVKTILRLEQLPGRTPARVQQEIHARFLAHNLIRWTMLQAAITVGVDLDRLSFKGTLDALQLFATAWAGATSAHARAKIWDQLLHLLAADSLRLRPGRREPRAVKRRKNKYPRLNLPRSRFRDHPKRHTRRARSRRRARAKATA